MPLAPLVDTNYSSNAYIDIVNPLFDELSKGSNFVLIFLHCFNCLYIAYTLILNGTYKTFRILWVFALKVAGSRWFYWNFLGPLLDFEILRDFVFDITGL